ncbi:hypothetical protein [Synechococcus sp. CBW1107]|uniref:hypothetical protein n=1 Tax=Synechococcus sp. CBW1107 TaxID=2789857 RepID=UPI002AD36EF9|nr:hypothetical protein [Synechococcus sp. CBW1107]CAK6686617.1 hypothetical protein MNNICLKF_00053 [Synechococcus sp. CBW1107]
MAIQRENYGYLPQLFTFDRNACVPTATVNIMAALARTYPSLRSLISSNGDVTYQDLAATRDTLATDYFYTSKNWQPTGSPLSLVIKGVQSYVADRNLAQALEVEAIGPELDSREVEKIGNFGITEKAVSIESPSRGRLEKTVTTPSISDPIIQRSYRGGGVTIQDIQQALDNGDGLLLGLIYDGQLAGHGVSAVNLDWTDRNGNGRADGKEDATLTIVDPLNPSENYSQATPGNVDNQQRFDPLVEALGPVKTTKMTLISSNRGQAVIFNYNQSSLDYDKNTGEPKRTAGDTSNNTRNSNVSGKITFAGILTARSIKRDIITGTSDDNVIELDPGRQRIKGGKGSDAFVIGDLDSLQEGQSDVLIDFKSKQNDQIGLSGDALSIDEIDLISVNSRLEQNLAKRSDHTLIYRQRENTGILYLNTNGDDRGWGATGGELVRLKGAPDLNATDLFIS